MSIKNTTADDLHDLINVLRPTKKSAQSVEAPELPDPVTSPLSATEPPIPTEEGSQGASAIPDAPAARPAVSSSHSRRSESATTTVIRRGRGRPPQEELGGKRSDPAYRLAGAYIRKDTHLAVQRELLDRNIKSGEKQDYSDLVEELLTAWLRRGRHTTTKE